jgi:hypothetical protein
MVKVAVSVADSAASGVDVAADAGSAGSGHRGDDQPFDERCRAEQHAVGAAIAEQFERELGAEHGTAEIHEHDDAGRAVDLFDGRLDLHGVGAERRVVQSGGNGDARLLAVQHLGGEADRGVGKCAAVRDDDEADAAHHLVTCAHGIASHPSLSRAGRRYAQSRRAA